LAESIRSVIDQPERISQRSIQYSRCELWGENLFEGDWAKPTLCLTAG
jgi:hypothetical protein